MEGKQAIAFHFVGMPGLDHWGSLLGKDLDYGPTGPVACHANSCWQTVTTRLKKHRDGKLVFPERHLSIGTLPSEPQRRSTLVSRALGNALRDARKQETRRVQMLQGVATSTLYEWDVFRSQP
jgi:hypothetical protein